MDTNHPVWKELEAREPLFHQPEFGVSRAELEAQVASNFFEVGASGQVYERERVISIVASRFKNNTEADTSQWFKSDFKCQELGGENYLVTYQLNQNGRLSRRITIWHRSQEKWVIVYHQGTLISS